MLQRMVSSFVTRDTDPIKSPFRSGGISVFVGSMLMIVIMAGFGVFGLIRPGGNTSWKVDDTLVLEKGTGAVYVFREGTLYPMANFASARLLVPPGTKPRGVSAASLAGTDRGAVLGIAGAPDTLVEPKLMLRGGWTLCARPDLEEDEVSAVRTVLSVGETISGGTALGDSGVLVRGTGTEQTSLLWRGHRYAFSQESAVALGLADQAQVPVPDTWLDALPRGGDIDTTPVENLGGRSELIEGALVGQVLDHSVEGAVRQRYVLLEDALLPVTPLQATIALSAPAAAEAYPTGSPAPVPVTSAQVADLPRVDAEPLPDDIAPPTELPAIAAQRPADSVCVTWDDAATDPTIAIAVEDVPSGQAVGIRADGLEGVADEVVVAPGRAVLVEAPTSPDESTGALSLVADNGLRYGIPSTEAVAALGYGASELVRMPSALVDRIPAGPSLDPVRAVLPVEDGAAG